MKELDNYRDFLMDISDGINVFIYQYFSKSTAWIPQVILKILVLIAFYFIVDFLFKITFQFVRQLAFRKSRFLFIEAMHQAKFPQSISHIFALSLCSFALNSLFYEGMHQVTKGVLDKLVDVAKVIVVGGAGLRLYKSVELYYILLKEEYKLIAFKAISQTIKIFGGVILFFIAIKIIFGISSGTILGSLGAITAVLVLVFRDTILGVVTGIHVATSRTLKVGDWIGIPKYNLEGNVLEISLLTTKIQNFDKTISTVPTYDLMTTEIRNYQVMTEGNKRRIKRSIIFNINSFKFLEEKDFEELGEIKLISGYLAQKKEEIEQQRIEDPTTEIDLNGLQLTNIGVFRKYVDKYLRSNPHIDQNEIVLVRQMEVTDKGGLPLEIYCFTVYSGLENYERVQSDIFDHLLVAAKEFHLEIMQVSKI